jgi:uncharacterized damage-inducible protein DinB
MLMMIDQLIEHKWWANKNLLRAIGQHAPATEDAELRKLLHHILVANRYWLLLTLGQPFVDEVEKRIPESHKDVVENFAATEKLEIAWLSSVSPSDLERPLQPRALPDITVTVAQAMLQISLHSHGHRSQCASRLRALGGTPLPMDFVLWVRDQAVKG